MKNNVRKHLVLVFTSVLLLMTVSSALAIEITPYADPVFYSTTISLMTTKKVDFDASTYEIMDSISVTACSLEKHVNNAWTDAGSLTPPSKVNTNTFGYSASMDYSAKIGTGTYRIKATFNADGHEVTRYSNSRAF